MTQLWRNGNVNSGEMCGWHRGHLSEWERHHLAPHCPRKHCPTSAEPQQVQNSKNILQQTLEIKQAVPCLLSDTDPCISLRFPGYHFVLRRVSPFCSLKFSVLQMTTFYKPISEEVDSLQGQGENTGSNTRRLCFALSFNCATKLPQSFPAGAEFYTGIAVGG